MRMKTLVGTFAMVATLLSVGAAEAQTKQFRIRQARAQFVSSAPLETINGVSNRASGTISVNPANLSGASATVTVPVSSLRTGIDIRDEHLRGAGWLNASANPNITFELTGVEGASALSADTSHDVTLRGRITINGVARDVRARGRVRWEPTAEGGERLRIRATFSVNLPRHGISVPAVMRLKVNDDVQVSFAASAVAG